MAFYCAGQTIDVPQDREVVAAESAARARIVKTQSYDPATCEAAPHRTKMVVVGESGVGKTSIIGSFANPWHGMDTHPATVCYDITNVRVNFDDGHVMCIDIYDTAGTERFRSVPVSLLRNADIALVVCSVDELDIKGSVARWNGAVLAAAVASSTKPPGVRILVANKADSLVDAPSAAVPDPEPAPEPADRHVRCFRTTTEFVDAVERARPRRTTADVCRTLERLVCEFGFAGYWIVSAKTKRNLVDLMCAVAAAARCRRDADPDRCPCPTRVWELYAQRVNPPPPSREEKDGWVDLARDVRRDDDDDPDPSGQWRGASPLPVVGSGAAAVRVASPATGHKVYGSSFMLGCTAATTTTTSSDGTPEASSSSSCC
jgi:signal recognition particle receptor subunit beta